MKKNLFIILSLFAVWLVWCTTSKQSVEIDSREGEQLFNSQVEKFQYIEDLEDFVSYNVESIIENKPFTSDLYFSAKFDENSSLQWGVIFSQKKNSKTHDLENRDISINIKTQEKWTDAEPFDLSWSVSILYRDNEMYANLHDLNVFMWEGNMVAKMYTLLWDLVIDKWINLEIHSGWAITIDESEDKKLPYLVSTIKNVLKTENIESSPDFLWSLVELIDTINSYIDLWISTDELKIVNYDISYLDLWDKSIQKIFTWSFEWKNSSFDLSFLASKELLEIHIYNIKEYSEDISDYRDIDSDFILSIQEKNNSEYSILFQLLKNHQKIVDLQWILKYKDSLDFSADFVLEPLEIVSWQKISWKLDGNIIKKSWQSDKEIPELTWNILSLSELLSSL